MNSTLRSACRLGLAALAIIGVLACNPDLTAPHRSAAKPAVPTGARRDAAPGDSPESQQLKLTADSDFDHFGGGHSTPGDSVVYKYTTVIKLSASGTVTKVSNYSPLLSSTSFGPGGRMVVSVSSGAANNPYIFSGDNTVSTSDMYLTVHGTLQSASRAGAENESQYGAGTWNGAPLYCGREYDPNWCYHYEGDVGSVTATRLSAGLSLTVDSSLVT